MSLQCPISNPQSEGRGRENLDTFGGQQEVSMLNTASFPKSELQFPETLQSGPGSWSAVEACLRRSALIRVASAASVPALSLSRDGITIAEQRFTRFAPSFLPPRLFEVKTTPGMFVSYDQLIAGTEFKRRRVNTEDRSSRRTANGNGPLELIVEGSIENPPLIDEAKLNQRLRKLGLIAWVQGRSIYFESTAAGLRLSDRHGLLQEGQYLRYQNGHWYYPGRDRFPGTALS